MFENMYKKNALGIDLEKSFEEFLEMQHKIIKGAKVMMDVDYEGSDQTPKDLVYQQDKMQLYHYKPLVKKPETVPTLIVYALVNKQYMMDLQTDKSVIRNLLNEGLDLYIIDWGYPTNEDMYLNLDDYINGYINDAVDHILEETGQPQLNIIGVCQGGTFSVIYTASHQEKVKNLVTMVTPVDFSGDDGILIQWSKYMNPARMNKAFGVIPGDFMNLGFNMLKPYQLMIDKYIGIIDKIDNEIVVENFMRMEKWIFDSPAQAGAAFEEFLVKMYQNNELAEGKLEIGGEKILPKNIKCPLLAIIGEHDHLVPESAARPILDIVGSKDKELVSYPVGHIGLYVSSRSKNEVAPKIAGWLKERSK